MDKIKKPKTNTKAWPALLILTMLWSILTGISLAKNIWLNPNTGMLGLMILIVLAVTLYKSEKQK